MSPSFNSIYISDKEMCKEVKEYVGLISPDREKIVKEFKGDVPLFDQFGIEKTN